MFFRRLRLNHTFFICSLSPTPTQAKAKAKAKARARARASEGGSDRFRKCNARKEGGG